MNEERKKERKKERERERERPEMRIRMTRRCTPFFEGRKQNAAQTDQHAAGMRATKTAAAEGNNHLVNPSITHLTNHCSHYKETNKTNDHG